MEDDLSRVLNALPGLVWTALPDGQIDFLNQRWCEYTGLRVDEACGFGWHTAIHPEDLPQLLERWQTILASGEPGEMEARLRRFDGDYRWFHVSASPLRDAAGSVVKWYGVSTDIEDRRRAEEALRVRELSFRLIVDSIPAPVAVTTPTGEVEALNQPTLEYFGKTYEELKGWKSSDVVHPDDLQRTVAAQIEAHEMGRAYNVESRHRRSDGVYRWFNVLGLPLRDTEGHILRWFILQIDIDDRKRAEEALRSAERDLNQIINTIPALAWSAGKDGSAEFFNQQYLDFVGLSAEEANGLGWTAAVHPDDINSLAATWASIIASEEPGEAEARMRGHDGEYRWFLFRVSPVRDEQGNIVKWYGINTEIDDRKRAEALLAGEKRLLEIVAGGNTLPSILDALCRLVEETASGYICGILLLDTSGTSVELARAPSLPSSYNEAILGWPVNPDSGPCARAASLKEQVIVADVASDLQWDAYGWRSLALSYGLRACWSTPILSSKNAVLGTFALYSREPGGPTPQLQDVIGQMTHLAAVAIERQRAVEQLEAERELLDLAQKSARAMAFDWHIQQDVNVWSPEQEALYGLPPGSFDGTYQGWKKLIYVPDWPVLLRAIEHAHETGEVVVEFRVVWPDGTFHWLATNGQMFFDEQGQPFRMVGFTSDITPRKLAEEDLRRSEAFLAEAQHLSSIGSFAWHVATNQITWSEQLYRIYELETGAPVTLELIRTRVHPEDLTLYEKMVGQARNGGDDFEWQYRLLMPDGTIKYLHAVAHATRDQDGELEYIAAVQDVTERRLSEEALGKLRSELAHVSRVATLGALTASIAHEVNQPLSGIITNASTCQRMLAADPPNVEGARETTRRTIRDGNRASEVITRLRALFGKRDATTEAVDLNEATREVIALSLSELQGSRIILRTELPDDLPPVMGDRVQLQQVILNLIRNASDAMSAVGDRPRDLLIRTERDDDADRVRLSVQDAGVGFEPQAADRLFQAFYTTKDDGMGIGLSVSRSIIESHHGQLWATSNDGPGATFSFSIPCGPLV
jgi:PAS domain S-box-containing protein